MKITFLMPAGGISGGNRVIALYAERLVARGHSVHVVWQRMRPQGLGAQLDRLIRVGARGRRRQGSPFFDSIGVTQSIAARPRFVTDEDVPDADVVVATWWETAFSVAALSPAKGRKFYFIQHHEVHAHLPWQMSRATYYLPLKKITISQWLVDTMAREYGDHDVALIENSVDMRQFDAPPREKNAVPAVGLLYSGKAFKGLDISVRAIEVARARVPDLRVISFGAIPEKGRAKVPLPEGTTYFEKPAQEKIREIYAMCDVWLCGSRLEGFHLPPLEAMACRCPVVSTRVGGAVDVVTEGVDGHLVDIGDAEALGQRLADVASLSPEAWKRMSDAAHARAGSYTWDDATDRLEAALADVPKGEPQRRAG